MLDVWIFAIVSVIAISLISFIGLWTISIGRESLKKLLLYLVSFAAGGMFGDAFIHLLPEIVEQDGFTISISLFVLLGVVIFFILEKMISWHHYHLPHTKEQAHPFAVMNLIGDAFHNMIDGLIVGVSYVASIPVGIATTVAVFFHEIPQEIGDFGVLLHGGYSKSRALWLNFISALTALLGVILALLLTSVMDNVTSFLIPFAAGGFIYVAGSDLIPEMHKENTLSKSVLQISSFILGIVLMLVLLLLEPTA